MTKDIVHEFDKAFHLEKNPQLIECLLSEILNLASEIVCITTVADGRFLYVNNTFLQESGYRNDQVIGFSDIELGIGWVHNDRPLFRHNLEQNGIVENVQLDFQTLHGTTKTYLLTAKKIELLGVPCILCLARDITDRKEDELKLQKSLQDDLRQTMQAVDNLVFKLVMNQRNQLIYVLSEGKIAQEMGMTTDRIAGKTMQELFPADILDIVQPHMMKALDGQQTSYEVQIAGRVLYKTLSPYIENGQITGVVGSALDITEKRNLEKLLRASELGAIVGQLAAGAAHEIRNPLTSIKGFIQLIGEVLDKNGITQGRSYIDLVLDELARINQLVSEMLLLQKPKESTYVPINVSTVIQAVLPLIHVEANLRSVQVTVHSDASSHRISGSSDLLKQVILNICKNGIEAMNDGGSLFITERHSSEQYELEIRDTGPGMPDEVKEKMFTPFFTTKDKGNGLGLFICRQIISDMGGQIEIQSDTGGTAVTLTFPVLSH